MRKVLKAIDGIWSPDAGPPAGGVADPSMTGVPHSMAGETA